MAIYRPHLPVSQPHPPIWLGRGNGVQPPSARRMGRRSAHCPPPSPFPPLPPPVSNPGTTPHLAEAAELVGAGPEGAGGGAGRYRSGGGPMSPICTNAGKPSKHYFTACPLTMCHKCGQPEYIQPTASTRINRQTTAAVTGWKEGPG